MGAGGMSLLWARDGDWTARLGGLFSAAAETGARGFGGGERAWGDADWVGGWLWVYLGGFERGVFQPRERVWWRLCVRVEGLVRFRLDWRGGVRVFLDGGYF